MNLSLNIKISDNNTIVILIILIGIVIIASIQFIIYKKTKNNKEGFLDTEPANAQEKYDKTLKIFEDAKPKYEQWEKELNELQGCKPGEAVGEDPGFWGIGVPHTECDCEKLRIEHHKDGWGHSLIKMESDKDKLNKQIEDWLNELKTKWPILTKEWGGFIFLFLGPKNIFSNKDIHEQCNDLPPKEIVIKPSSGPAYDYMKAALNHEEAKLELDQESFMNKRKEPYTNSLSKLVTIEDSNIRSKESKNSNISNHRASNPINFNSVSSDIFSHFKNIVSF